MVTKTLHATKLRNAAEYARASWHVQVEPGIDIEDVQVPGFWAHHYEKINVNDLIDVLGEGFDIQLRVIGKGIGLVETRLLRKWVSEAPVHKMSAEESAALEAMIPEGYVVDHTPKTLWRVKLKDGGIELVRNQKTKSDAIQAALGHAQRSQGIAA